MSNTLAHRVVIQQVDLDTCLTALLLGVSAEWQIDCRAGGALADELADPSVLCIEAGGSGDVSRANFDHHDAQGLPPACVQAYRTNIRRSAGLDVLVAYVAQIDVGQPGSSALFPSLSHIFSGLRLVIRDPVEQLRAGLALLDAVVVDDLDPRGPLPLRSGWEIYRDRKLVDLADLEATIDLASWHRAQSGSTVGYLETGARGALGALYERGAQIGVAYCPVFEGTSGQGLIAKFTIGSAYRDLRSLLARLEGAESGWGGPAHGTVIGSPRTGTRLSPEFVLERVLEWA